MTGIVRKRRSISQACLLIYFDVNVVYACEKLKHIFVYPSRSLQSMYLRLKIWKCFDGKFLK